MITVSKLLPQGQGLASALLRRAATVTLDWDTRQKSRFECTDSQGRSLAVFLPRGTLVRGGDVFVAEDGSMVRVLAADQSVLRITHCAHHGTPHDVLRAAYHLGNRHVPIELGDGYLQMEPDHVLAQMLDAMHLIVTPMQAPFEPEGGAYAAGGHGHGHGHEAAHVHEHHAQPASTTLRNIPVIEAGHHHHAHHEGCGCGAHGHDHDHGHPHTHGHTPPSAPKKG